MNSPYGDHPKLWIELCDGLIEYAEHDKELKDGLAWIDRKFNDNGKNSIYDIILAVLSHDGVQSENIKSFMKDLMRKEKND